MKVVAGTCLCVPASLASWLRVPYVCFGAISTYTFWRFLIQIPLSESEMMIQYSINDGLAMDFFVPGRHQTMRLAVYSVSHAGYHCSVPS
jgi:hypothetical protein